MDEFATLKDSKYTHWLILPLKGIAIGGYEEMPKLIFRDATLVSCEELKGLDVSFDTEHWEDGKRLNIKKELSMLAGVNEADSFLLVGGFKSSKDDVRLQRRAEEIVSTLCCVMLHYSNVHRNCKMLGDVFFYPQYSKAEVHKNAGLYSWTDVHLSTEAHIVMTKHAYAYTRQELVDLLNAEHLKPLCDIMLFNRYGCKPNWRSSLYKALRQVYRAHDALTPEVQLIGAVTALEILFGVKEGERSDGFNLVKSRLKWFIGAQHNKLAYKNFVEIGGEGIDVFQLRHDSVHKVLEIGSASAAKAIHLIIQVLPMYAQFVVHFQSVQELLAFMDVARSLGHYGSASMRMLAERWKSIPDNREPMDSFLPFLLNQWFGDDNGIVVPNPKTIEEKFALAVSIVEMTYKLNREQAFEKSSQYYAKPAPFPSSDDLNRFFEERPDLYAEAQEKYEYLKQRYVKWHAPNMNCD